MSIAQKIYFFVGLLYFYFLNDQAIHKGRVENRSIVEIVHCYITIMYKTYIFYNIIGNLDCIKAYYTQITSFY